MNRLLRALRNRTRTWVRPGWFLSMMVSVYLVCEAIYAYRRWWLHANAGVLLDIAVSRDSLMLAFTVVAGMLRAVANHPLFWTDYGRWLARTPWRMPKPLPLGPTHLAFADVAFMAIVVLSLNSSFFSLLRVPLLFLTGYLAVVCVGLWATATRAHAYAIAFGLGLVIRLWMDATAATAVAVLLYPVAYFGLRHSLARFPWRMSSLATIRSAAVKLTLSTDLGQWLSQRQTRSLGWPFDLLRPDQPSNAIGWCEGTTVSLLLGWWAYAFTAPMDPELQRGFLLFSLLIPFFMALTRLTRYTANYRSPINSWGRLFTFRWIIPGYDKVLVAPLLALAIPWLAVWRLSLRMHLDLLAVAPIAIGCASLCVLNLGPTLRDWRHTGNHRIVPKYNSTTHLQL